MRQNKLGKITTSITFEVNQLERLNEIAHRARVSRSTIVRDAIERELQRYERSHPPRKVDPLIPQEGKGTAAPADTRRP